METLTELLLEMNTMETLPEDVLRKISGLVLDKSITLAVLTDDTETLESIYHFQRHRIDSERVNIGFKSIFYRKNETLAWFDKKMNIQ